MKPTYTILRKHDQSFDHSHKHCCKKDIVLAPYFSTDTFCTFFLIYTLIKKEEGTKCIELCWK